MDQLTSTIGSQTKLGLQKKAYNFRRDRCRQKDQLTKLRLRKSGTTLGEIVRLHNCAVADKGSIDQLLRGFPLSEYQLCSCLTSQHSKGQSANRMAEPADHL